MTYDLSGNGMLNIRLQVREFESINGHFSMPEAEPKPDQINGEAAGETEKTAEPGEADSLNAVKSSDNIVSTDATDRVRPSGSGDDYISADDASKASDKTDPMELDEQKTAKCINSATAENPLKSSESTLKVMRANSNEIHIFVLSNTW